jgi:hypothetical protein
MSARPRRAQIIGWLLACTCCATWATQASPAAAAPGAKRKAKRSAKGKLKPLTLTLRLRVARCSNNTRGKRRAVRGKRWIDRHLAATRRIFARHGVQLAVERDHFTPGRCVLLTRRHRHAMAQHAPKGPWATVLLTQRVRDLDVPSYNLMGVHWRYRGRNKAWRGRRYVLLTARAKPPVLAHELSHFLGLRHDPKGGNLLTPGPSDPIWKSKRKPKPFVAKLTAKQGRRLRAGVRRLHRVRETVAKARSAPSK